MHVGVVAYELEGQSTGVGRYLAGLLAGVAEVAPPWRWTLFFHGERFEHELFGHPRFEPVFAGRRGRAPVPPGGRAPDNFRVQSHPPEEPIDRCRPRISPPP